MLRLENLVWSLTNRELQAAAASSPFARSLPRWNSQWRILDFGILWSWLTGSNVPERRSIMTDKKFLQGILTAFCLAAIAACKPSEPPKPESSAETAEVEAKIQKFKATPAKATMEEVDRALANMNAKIKELESRESQMSGAEKEKTAAKLSALRTQYNLYTVEIAGMKVQAVTDRALEKAKAAVEKAGDAMKDAADSVSDSFKSTNN